MAILVTSPSTIRNAPDPSQLCAVLAQASSNGIPVLVVSNKPIPGWLHNALADSEVMLQREIGRQNGNIIKTVAENNEQQPQDVLVLAASEVDMRMAKSGGAVLVAANWSKKQSVLELGIQIANAGELDSVLSLNNSWDSGWYYVGKDGHYQVVALTDLSTYGKDYAAAEFAKQLTGTVKQGGPRLKSLLAITARSLMTGGWSRAPKLAWGIFPSSSSANDDSDTLSDFGHRLRTTVSRVRFAKRGEPLFVRHKPSVKRSTNSGGDRTDPTDQIKTLHLNPCYRDKLQGRNVILLDDCTTYGVSFGVAAALLRAACAASMTGIALGKFGNCIQYYDIDIQSDPFAPVTDYTITEVRQFNAQRTDSNIQRDLRELM